MEKYLKRFLALFAVCILYCPSQALSEFADSTIILNNTFYETIKVSPDVCTEIQLILDDYNPTCPDTTLCVECNSDISIGSFVTEDGAIITVIKCGKEIIETIECLNTAQQVLADSISATEKTIASNSCCPLPQNIIDLKKQLSTLKYHRSRINFIMNYLNAKLKYIDILLDS